MCTAINLKDIKENNYFGRTMDFSYVLDPSIYVCPKNYILKNSFSTVEIKNKYSFIGVGQNISKVIFADGVNEKGVGVATLYFPKFATYDLPYTYYNKYHIESLEMVNFLLGNCGSLEEAHNLLQNVSVVGVKDCVTNSIAPLHWIMTDRSGKSLVIENREDGMHILNNPIGVLSNSPDFKWHMLNLQNYMNLSTLQYEEANWGNLQLTPFGQGAGALGLPGDYTPPSRFVRAAFQKTHVTIPKDKKESMITFFHIMESVSIPKGIVITERGVSDYTQYTSFMDLQTCQYFFKTYDNSQILYASLLDVAKRDEIIEIGKLNNPQRFQEVSNI